jgi:ABC-type glutathione transport system ATPase component
MQTFKAYSCEAKEIKGKKVWVEISCTKEERALIDVENQLSDLIEAGAVPGSRVTLSDIPVETVRAAEITAVNTPAKKFEVWAENSNVEFSDSRLKKIESLDAEITHGATKAEGEWEIASLRLRGAIGIMKGVKKEEIAVNFDKYDSGLIALIGANGKGKTTLIENCHPYPRFSRGKANCRITFT